MIGRVFRVIRTPLTLLVLLAILCYGAWWGWNNIIKPSPPAPQTPCVPTKVTKRQLLSSQVTVQVFNGGNKRGLAGDVSQQLRNKKFNTLPPQNTDTKVTKTVIIGNGAKNPEVLLVKSFFKNATVKADGRADRTVDVMVGSQYGGFNGKAKTSYPVSSDTVCLPAESASPSAKQAG
ncbi:hypothetical protein FHX74_001518 [Friedmanniella endophytica]|uniref:LytR/CpsA/Psr regulator C-terminal domain-containing protein n=1 Tax=Microlunatus kandeliicorticis TaxID=1759536 RepID=A0A7W3IRH0_9ACTN|nr:LytR C-terminal domain-containing protein [Microlunatus kandeliicorticis]MBA8793913.1 hypothetical protein [Microlunatus kandeliicorticis]